MGNCLTKACLFKGVRTSRETGGGCPRVGQSNFWAIAKLSCSSQKMKQWFFGTKWIF